MSIIDLKYNAPPTISRFMQSGGIYQILNTVNGKRYIGSAKCFKARWSSHESALRLNKHHARHLQSAFNKYGADRFVFQPLLVCDSKDLLFYEQRAIDRFLPEYNSSPTAGNTLGVRCSPERRKKIGDAHRGRKQSAETREKKRIASTGRKVSEETRAKMRVAQKAQAADPTWREKVIAGKVGKPLSDQHKKKLSEAKRGKKIRLSEETRLCKNAKIAQANTTRVISDEFRRNASEAQKNSPRVERFEYAGRSLTVLELAELSGVNRHTVRKRLNAGWSVERSVTQIGRNAK